MRINLRFLVLVLGFSLSCLADLTTNDNYLLIDQSGIEAALSKANTEPWASNALAGVLTRASDAMKRPVVLPPRGGQWTHWYSCKKDGANLITDSPTSHRCPECGTVYHGDPYDAVIFSRDHSRWSKSVRDLGLAYRFTGRKEFAQKAGEILSGYADKYSKYPLHNVNGDPLVSGGHVMAQSLDESVWLIPMTFGYALVRDALPPEARAHIEKDLLTAAATAISEHKMGIHNIQCWKNTAVGLVGFVVNSTNLVNEAIDDPKRGFRVQLDKGVTEDGLWYEGSLGYHTYTMEALWPLAEAARLRGVNLYDERFRKMFEAPINLALPDGAAPGFNDNSGGNVTVNGFNYELAFARWKTPEFGRIAANSDRKDWLALLYGEKNLPTGTLIPTASVLMKDAGFAILRTNGNAVAMHFGPNGSGHGHPDKLNIVTFADGHLFGLDPASINYGVPLHKEWYRATIAHNTVTVDQTNQAPVTGVLEKWGENGITAMTDNAYPGVTLRRSVKLDGKAIQDRFECRSIEEHDYDYAFHALGKFSASLEMKARGPLSYLHIEKVSEAHTDKEWWAEWNADGVCYRLTFKAVPGTVVLTGVGPGRNPVDRVPMILVRRHGKETVFDCEHTFRSSP